MDTGNLWIRHARSQVYLDRQGNETPREEEAARFSSPVEVAAFLAAHRASTVRGQWIVVPARALAVAS